MAIRITFPHENEDEMREQLNDFHEALKGTPGYINNEIALCETSATEFVLVIGNDNDFDKDLIIDD